MPCISLKFDQTVRMHQSKGSKIQRLAIDNMLGKYARSTPDLSKEIWHSPFSGIGVKRRRVSVIKAQVSRYHLNPVPKLISCPTCAAPICSFTRWPLSILRPHRGISVHLLLCRIQRRRMFAITCTCFKVQGLKQEMCRQLLVHKGLRPSPVASGQ